MGPVSNHDHLEAEVLPKGVDEAVDERDREGQKDHLNRVKEGLLFSLLDPLQNGGDNEGNDVLIDLHDDSDGGELGEFPLVGVEEAFHEGESVFTVLSDVVHNSLFDQLFLVLDFQVFWYLTELFQFDVLLHRGLQDRPGVAVEEGIEEADTVSHVFALEDLTGLLLFCVLHF